MAGRQVGSAKPAAVAAKSRSGSSGGGGGRPGILVLVVPQGLRHFMLGLLVLLVAAKQVSDLLFSCWLLLLLRWLLLLRLFLVI